MKKQSISRKVKYNFHWLLLSTWAKFSGLLPEQWSIKVNEKLSSLGLIFFKKKIKIIKPGLELIFDKNLTDKETKEFLMNNFGTWGRFFGEIFYLIKRDVNLVKNRVKLIGAENFAQALAYNKGVIAVSAHIGNFPLMLAALVQLGYPITVVAKEPHNKKIANWFRKLRKQYRIGEISTQEGKKALQKELELLSKNNIIVMLIDQAVKDGMKVRFFNKFLPIRKAPVVLAKKTDAPLVPLFTYYDKTIQKHKIIVEKPFFIELNSSQQNKENEYRKNLQYLMDRISAYIKEYPEQWWCLHTRWVLRLSDQIS